MLNSKRPASFGLSIRLFSMCAAAILLSTSHSILAAASTSILTNVPEAATYKLVYQVDIANGNNFSASVPYSVNNSGTIQSGVYTRVAYYLELQTGTNPLQWVYVSFDAANFQTNPTKIGVPNVPSGEFYHYIAGTQLPNTGQVANMTVLSNVPGIVTGTGISTGSVQFWPSNYNQNNDYAVPNASAAATNQGFDWGDGGAGTGQGYGQMSINNYGASQVLFAFNNWNGGGGDLGIGNNPNAVSANQGVNYTFSNNVASYTTLKTLQILIQYPQPTITSVTPAGSVPAGGTPLTIVGTNFFPGAQSITFGGVPATNLTYVNSTTYNCTAPAGTLGSTVNVVMTDVFNDVATLTNGFTYSASPPPGIASVTPATGTTAGGTIVTITGGNFVAPMTVDFGPLGGVVSNITPTSPTSMTVTVPSASSAGVTSIKVSSAGGNATLSNSFTYTSPANTTYIWVGGNAGNTNFSNGANWIGGLAPVSGNLSFPANATSFTAVNDMPAGTTYGNIVISGDAYSITGSTSTNLTGSINVSNATITGVTFGVPTKLTGAPQTTWTVGANSKLILAATIDVNGNTLPLNIGANGAFTFPFGAGLTNTNANGYTFTVTGAGSFSALSGSTINFPTGTFASNNLNIGTPNVTLAGDILAPTAANAGSLNIPSGNGTVTLNPTTSTGIAALNVAGGGTTTIGAAFNSLTFASSILTPTTTITANITHTLPLPTTLVTGTGNISPTGTTTVNAGNSPTNFLTTVAPGDILVCGSPAIQYPIVAVNSPTQLVTTGNVTAGTNIGFSIIKAGASGLTPLTGAGTVTTNGTTTVTGTGTNFGTGVVAGDAIVVAGVQYVVSLVNSSAQTLTTTVAVPAATAVSYSVIKTGTNVASGVSGVATVRPLGGQAGTVTTNASTTVAGNVTTFTQVIAPGDLIVINNISYTVATVVSDTSLTTTLAVPTLTAVGFSVVKTGSNAFYGQGTLTPNNTTVTAGNGTSFTTQLLVGDTVVVNGIAYSVVAIYSATSFGTSVAIPTATGVPYQIIRPNSLTINALNLNQASTSTISAGYLNINVNTPLQNFPPNTPASNATLAGNISSSTPALTGGATATLTTAVSSGTATTSLAVSALPFGLSNGAVMALSSGGNVQYVTLGAAASAGATSVTVASFTPTVNFPVGTAFLATLTSTAGNNTTVTASGTVFTTVPNGQWAAVGDTLVVTFGGITQAQLITAVTTSSGTSGSVVTVAAPFNPPITTGTMFTILRGVATFSGSGVISQTGGLGNGGGYAQGFGNVLVNMSSASGVLIAAPATANTLSSPVILNSGFDLLSNTTPLGTGEIVYNGGMLQAYNGNVTIPNYFIFNYGVPFNISGNVGNNTVVNILFPGNLPGTAFTTQIQIGDSIGSSFVTGIKSDNSMQVAGTGQPNNTTSVNRSLVIGPTPNTFGARGNFGNAFDLTLTGTTNMNNNARTIIVNSTSPNGLILNNPTIIPTLTAGTTYTITGAASSGTTATITVSAATHAFVWATR